MASIVTNFWVSLVITSLSIKLGSALSPPSGSLPLDFHSNMLFARLMGSDENANNSSRATMMPQAGGFINCNKTKYRSDLRAQSCADAVSQIPRTQHIQRFARRTLGPEASDVGLPYRFISGES